MSDIKVKKIGLKKIFGLIVLLVIILLAFLYCTNRKSQRDNSNYMNITVDMAGSVSKGSIKGKADVIFSGDFDFENEMVNLVFEARYKNISAGKLYCQLENGYAYIFIPIKSSETFRVKIGDVISIVAVKGYSAMLNKKAQAAILEKLMTVFKNAANSNYKKGFFIKGISVKDIALEDFSMENKQKNPSMNLNNYQDWKIYNK